MRAFLNLSLALQFSGGGLEWMGGLRGIDRRYVLLLHLLIAPFLFLRTPNTKWPSKIVSWGSKDGGWRLCDPTCLSQARKLTLNLKKGLGQSVGEFYKSRKKFKNMEGKNIILSLGGKMIKGKYGSFS